MAQKPARVAAMNEYQPPRPLAFQLSAETATLSELQSNPASKAALESINPALGNAVLASIFGFYIVPQFRDMLPGATTPEAIAKLNAALAKIPRGDWPVR
ncbi:hypothetical protein [Sphingobium boeckii]|uniref:Uncharacterized protein n=1 Tax=Sphingobium boeckii TaxID=1082345 RepID=A0A7W9ALD9_9SPHN|nr:hypothetical protein [Sphingobium boeckii]MBB5687825.1 hypothetical protein [Sphingobium boeckii]